MMCPARSIVVLPRDNHSLPPLFTRNPPSRNQLAKPFRSLPNALFASNTFLVPPAPFQQHRQGINQSTSALCAPPDHTSSPDPVFRDVI